MVVKMICNLKCYTNDSMNNFHLHVYYKCYKLTLNNVACALPSTLVVNS